VSPHLPLHRLDPGAVLDAEERAHLDQCPRCRVEARMLAAAMAGDPARTPGLGEARASLDQVRSRTLETLTTGVNSLSLAFGVIAAPHVGPDELPGVDTERFQAVRWVVTGPLGPVYEVEDLQTGRHLALRVLQDADDRTVARIRHTIDRLAGRRIPGIAPPMEIHKVGEHWTVASLWVSGQPLHAMLHGGTDPLRPEPADEADLPRVLVAVQQVAAALSRLHALGLVHGHLAPSNVFLTLLGRAVLLDPGLWSPRPDTRASSPWVAYASPERIAGADPTPAGDWYGLGALMHHALTGQIPRPGEVASADPEAEGVELIATLAAALTDPDPEARPGAAEVLATLVEIASHTVLATTRYLDVGLLGVGGMGEVRRVLDPSLNRTVALKVLHPRLGHTRGHEDRFIAEAQVTAQLEHPGIVPVYTSGRMPDGRPYFTMREVRGRTFAEVIGDVHAASTPDEWRPAESGWTFRRLVETFHRVCEAVAYAHARGVLHRDLKPSNVMVGDFGEVLVLDWGLARVRGMPWGTQEVVRTDRSLDPSQATQVGTVSGTPGYMSPEQARGETEALSPASDVYALGAILYQVLSGHPPFEGQDTGSVLRKVLTGSPPAPARPTMALPWATDEQPASGPAPSGPGGPPVPEALIEICATAMERDPGARFIDAQDLAMEVVAWLDGERTRERALRWVARARDLAPVARKLRDRAKKLRQDAGDALRDVSPWEPEERKRSGWAAQDEADALDLQAALRELEADQALHAAFAEAPGLSEAHAALARKYRAEHLAAEAARDRNATARAAVLLRSHVAALPESHPDHADHLAYLAGEGALTLVTDPPGAEVLLHRYEVRHRRLVPVLERAIGTTPIRAMTLPMGSYLLVLRAPGRAEVPYPVLIRRQHHWDGVPPGKTEPLPIHLPLTGALGPDECYVPAGWFQVGGDPAARVCGARQWLWSDGVVIERFPVTNGAYLAFLGALVAAGREADALEMAPRERGGSDGRQGALVYGRHPDGTFHLTADADGDLWAPDWPVVMVDCRCAAAFARWRADVEGHPWRLPLEWEWEKAARGVDGRFFPWGDGFDPSWCCMKDSHPHGRATVHGVSGFPVDESPYGVRGLGGNVRDWCAEPGSAGERVRPLQTPEASEPEWLAGRRACRGGSWNAEAAGVRSANRYRLTPTDRTFFVGFRLARSFPG